MTINKSPEANEKNNIIKDNTINIEHLIKEIGIPKIEKKLPNGRINKVYDYNPKYLNDIYLLVSKSYQKLGLGSNDNVVIDGFCTPTFLTTIVHALHPVSSSATYELTEEKLLLPLSGVQIEGEGEGIDLTYNIIEGENYNTIEFKLTVPQLDMEKTLYSIAAPKLPNKKPVLVKGRGPYSILAGLAEAYAHEVPFVACNEPGVGNIVCITHNQKANLGDNIDEIFNIEDTEEIDNIKNKTKITTNNILNNFLKVTPKNYWMNKSFTNFMETFIVQKFDFFYNYDLYEKYYKEFNKEKKELFKKIITEYNNTQGNVLYTFIDELEHDYYNEIKEKQYKKNNTLKEIDDDFESIKILNNGTGSDNYDLIEKYGILSELNKNYYTKPKRR